MAVKKDIIGADVQIGTNEAQASLVKLSKATAQLTKDNEALRIERAKMVAQGKKNTDEFKRLDQQIKENNKTIRDNKEQTQALSKTIGVTAMSANQLKKRARDLTAQMNGLSKSANPDEWNRLNKELDETNTQLGKVKAGTQRTSGGLSSLKGMAGGLLSSFGWGAIAAGAVAAGKKIYDLSKQTMEYRKQVQQLTDLQGKQLADFTATITGSAQTFNKEVQEMAIANNALAQAFNISNEEAQKLIDQGFIAGADATGEFLDQLREYPTQFKAAGLSAEETIAIMTQSVKSGVFSDKGADVIKEATIRLREMTPATQTALQQIGISSDELSKKLRSGSISYFDAIQLVSDKLGELPDQSTEVGTALADIFGGPGEDAGLAYIKTLGEIEGGMDGLIAKTGETGQAQLKLLDANQRIQNAWSNLLGTGTSTFDGITASIKVMVADALEGLVEWLQEVRDWFITTYNDSAPFRGVIQAFFLSWKLSINAIKTGLKGLWDVVKGTTNLILALFTFDADKIKAAWKQGVSDIKDTFTESATELADDFVNAYNKTVQDKIALPGAEPPEIKEKQKQAVAQNIKTTAATDKSLQQQFGPTDEDEMAEIEAELERDEKLFDEKFKLQEFYNKRQLKLFQEGIKNKEDAAKQEKKIEEDRIKAKEATLDAFIGIVGEESNLGQAALIVKKILAAREALLSITSGIANTAKVGFPQNIPLLISYGIQTGGILSSIASVPTGRKDGGYTSRSSSDDEIADFVHANEFVSSAKAVRNPTVKPYLDAIDIAQRNGTIESINLPSMVSGSGGASGPSPSENVSLPSEGLKGGASNTDAIAQAITKAFAQNPPTVLFDWDYDKRSRQTMSDLEKDVAT